MLKSYFLTALRSLRIHRLYSVLNIAGLSAGLAFAFLIGGYVWSELQVNSQVDDTANQYIVQSKWKEEGMGLELTTIGPLVKSLAEEYPALVAGYYRFDGITSTVSYGDKHFREGIQIGDSTLLTMFGFRLIEGSARDAFSAPYSVVITEARARKYFGKTDVVGRTVAIESFAGTKHDFKITAVMADPGQNSITQLNGNNDNQFFMSLNSAAFFGRDLDNWSNPYLIGFIRLKPGIKPDAIRKPLAALLKQRAPAAIRQSMESYLIGLKDFYRHANNGVVSKMLYTLICIAFFILAMAIINFINISISRSSTRIREIGVRKVLGGIRKQLIIQFLTESIVLVFLSALVALVVYTATRSVLGDSIGREIPSLFTFPVWYVVLPPAIALVVGFLAGFYPALILSSVKPVDSIKGKQAAIHPSGFLTRKVLVGFQFFTAAVVLAGGMIVSGQVGLFLNSDLGYDGSFVVSAPVPRNWSPEGVKRMEDLRKQFEELPEIVAASLSYEIPDGKNGSTIQVYPAGTDSSRAIPSQMLVSDEKYVSVYKINMNAGGFLSDVQIPSAVVINQTQASLLGWKDAREAIGNQLKVIGSPGMLTVKGVINDFQFGTMKEKIPPVIFFHVNTVPNYRFLSFRLRPGNLSGSMALLQQRWNTLLPGAAFEYKFMTDTLEKLYESEIRLKKASVIALVLTLLIALLGITGLVALGIQKRSKEIGIRKVLGASVAGISSLFLKEFLPVILVASVVACPVTWYLMQSWLNDYAYRIAITSQPFFVSIALLSTVTTLLIALQTWRIANEKAVTSLSKEQ